MDVFSFLHGAHPFRPVLDEQLLDEVLDHRLDLPGPVDLAAQNLLVDAEGVVVEERWVAR